MRYLCLYILLLVVVHSAHAQQLRFTHIGVGDGLSQSSIYNLYQDKQGFVWMGTGDGLNRYDGHAIKIYKLEQHPKVKGNSNFYDEGAAEDTFGNIYFSGRYGMVRYDFATDKIQRFFPRNDTANFNTMLKVLGFVNRKLVFFDLHAHIYLYDPLSKKLEKIAIKDPVSSVSKFRTADLDEYGRVWYTLHNGIASYNLHTGAFNYYLIDFFKQRNLDLHRKVIAQTRDNILIAAYKGVYELNLVTKQPRVLLEDETHLYFDLALDKNNTLWVGSMSVGLFSLKSTGTVQQYKHQKFNNISLGSNIITKLLIDRTGNLWAGCDGQGISKTNIYYHKFNLYRSEFYVDQPFKTNFIKCFYKDKYNRIWFGTHEGGIHILNRTTGKIINLFQSKFGRNIVAYFYPVSPDVLFVGCGSGIFSVNVNTLAIQSLVESPQKQNLSYYQTHQLYRLQSGKIWAPTLTGVKELKQINPNKYVFDPVTIIPSYLVLRMHQTKDQRIWVGAINGPVIQLKEHKNGSLSMEQKILEGYNVRSFYEDTLRNILWMSSEKGLIQYDLKSNRTKIITIKNGLLDDYIYGVLPGVDDELWLSTNKGLACYHTNSGKVLNFTEEDGLQSNEFNTGSFYRSEDGELFFGGIDGFNSFYPRELNKNSNKPNLVLTKLLVQDEEDTTLGNPASIKKLELPYFKNTLSFDFSALEFTAPLKNKYMYKLQGIDEKWVESGSRHFARYSGLSAGNYSLWVMACNNDGVWSNETLLLTITIHSPWWLRWWFVLLVSGGAIFIFYKVIRFFSTRRLKERLRELEKLEAVNKERARISKDMHDDLGSGLTKISILSELLKSQFKQDESGQVEKISKTARDLIDNMSHIIWAMNPSNDTVESLFAYIREYATDFFDQTEVNCKIDFKEMNSEIPVSQQTRRNIFLVVKESLHNIIKHAKANQVHIQAYLDNNCLVIIISDDGVGFDMNNTRRFGNGLLNMQKRMVEVNGNMEMQSEKRSGTRTTIAVPL